MKIFVSHATSSDFQHDLYDPLKQSSLYELHTFILPHDNSVFINTKETIQSSDFILAEVSYPSTGQGIELGWADVKRIPILCFYKQDANRSKSLDAITRDIYAYKNSQDLLQQLSLYIKNLQA